MAGGGGAVLVSGGESCCGVSTVICCACLCNNHGNDGYITNTARASDGPQQHRNKITRWLRLDWWGDLCERICLVARAAIVIGWERLIYGPVKD